MKNIRIPGGVVLCGAGLLDGIGVGFLVFSFLKGFDLSMLWNVSEHSFLTCELRHVVSLFCTICRRTDVPVGFVSQYEI